MDPFSVSRTSDTCGETLRIQNGATHHFCNKPYPTNTGGKTNNTPEPSQHSPLHPIPDSSQLARIRIRSKTIPGNGSRISGCNHSTATIGDTPATETDFSIQNPNVPIKQRKNPRHHSFFCQQNAQQTSGRKGGGT